MLTSTLTSKGQITIPQELRQLLELHSGDKVGFAIEDGHIILFPKLDNIEAAFGLCRAKKGVSLADMDRAIRKRAKNESP
jgi:antitoxin PrlF